MASYLFDALEEQYKQATDVCDLDLFKILFVGVPLISFIAEGLEWANEASLAYRFKWPFWFYYVFIPVRSLRYWPNRRQSSRCGSEKDKIESDPTDVHLLQDSGKHYNTQQRNRRRTGNRIYCCNLHVIKCKSTVIWHFTVLFVIVIVNQKKKIVR